MGHHRFPLDAIYDEDTVFDDELASGTIIFPQPTTLKKGDSFTYTFTHSLTDAEQAKGQGIGEGALELYLSYYWTGYKYSINEPEDPKKGEPLPTDPQTAAVPEPSAFFVLPALLAGAYVRCRR